MAEASLVSQHRHELQIITDAAAADSLYELSQQDPHDLDLDAFSTAVTDIAYSYAEMSAGAGADFYTELRSEAGLRSFQPRLVTSLSPAQTKALARWAIGPLYGAEPNPDAARSRLEGGMQRLVANADRATVAGNAARDPAKVRWYRATSAKACAFCAMLATRGAVYRSSESALRSHNHCHCLAVPIFPGGDTKLPSYYSDFAQEYDDARAAVKQAGQNMTAKNILAAWRGATERS